MRSFASPLDNLLVLSIVSRVSFKEIPGLGQQVSTTYKELSDLLKHTWPSYQPEQNNLVRQGLILPPVDFMDHHDKTEKECIAIHPSSDKPLYLTPKACNSAVSQDQLPLHCSLFKNLIQEGYSS